MNFIKAFFKTDKEYKDSLKTYERIDGVLAIIVYVLVMFLYYVMGVVYAKQNVYLGYEINFLLVLFCIICIVVRKQPITTIGFSKKNLFKSLNLGITLSAALLTIKLISGISGGYQFNNVSTLISKFGYYFFVIALAEEIIFRGFIQIRIYGIIKNYALAIILTALMFLTIHIPFQMSASKMGLLEFIAKNYITLLFTFIWHVVFNFLYSKYNSIAAPTVFHSIMDWCNEIFID